MIAGITDFLTKHDVWLRYLTLGCVILLGTSVLVRLVQSFVRLRGKEQYAFAIAWASLLAAGSLTYLTPFFELGIVALCAAAVLLLRSGRLLRTTGRLSLASGLVLLVGSAFPLRMSRPAEGDPVAIAAVVVACLGVLVVLSLGFQSAAEKSTD